MKESLLSPSSDLVSSVVEHSAVRIPPLATPHPPTSDNCYHGSASSSYGPRPSRVCPNPLCSSPGRGVEHLDTRLVGVAAAGPRGKRFPAGLFPVGRIAPAVDLEVVGLGDSQHFVGRRRLSDVRHRFGRQCPGYPDQHAHQNPQQCVSFHDHFHYSRLGRRRRYPVARRRAVDRYASRILAVARESTGRVRQNLPADVDGGHFRSHAANLRAGAQRENAPRPPWLRRRRGRGAFSRDVLPWTQPLPAKKPPVPSDWSAEITCRTQPAWTMTPSSMPYRYAP